MNPQRGVHYLKNRFILKSIIYFTSGQQELIAHFPAVNKFKYNEQLSLWYKCMAKHKWEKRPGCKHLWCKRPSMHLPRNSALSDTNHLFKAEETYPQITPPRMPLQFISVLLFITLCSLHVLMGTNQMPLKMLNRNDPIKECFEAYMNFKGIRNQNIFGNYSCHGMCKRWVCLCGNIHAHVCLPRCAMASGSNHVHFAKQH